MSHLNDQQLENLTNDLMENTNIDFSLDKLLEEFSNSIDPNQDFPSMFSPATLLLETNAYTPGGFSPENNSNSNTQELTTNVSNAAAFPATITCLKMIAQPTYGTKLRYRLDYEKNENRLGVLKNTTPNSSYQGPAINIPSDYRDPNGQYYIRVCLVTVVYNKTNLPYVHPYEIEDPKHEDFNDRPNNVVWFPIEREDCITGIKSFPSLRIVKKKASELKAYGNLRVFDCNNQNVQNCFLPQLSSPKDTISEYNLEKSQLAFTVGQKIIDNGQISLNLYPDTTVFSDEMIEGVGKEADADNDNQSVTEKPNPPPSNCRIYKYAPRSGFAESNEDMIIFLTNKLEPKKYGDLQVIFQYQTSDFNWTQPINDLDIKDRIVSFKTPIFNYSFDNAVPVDVILRQNSREIGTVKYFYLSIFGPCSSCQLNIVRNQSNIVQNISNKRVVSLTGFNDYETDGIVPVNTDVPELRQSKSQPDASSSSSSTTSDFTSLPPIHLPEASKKRFESLEEALGASVELLFLNNDYSLFSRVCRPFIKSHPQLCHDALKNNNTHMLLKFIPVATTDILQYKNEFGETLLLHAVRLNHIEVIKVLLKHKDSKILIEDIDKKNNNIFHILVLNSSSQETFDLLINYLLEKNISIEQKFDRPNQNHQTPLQLAVYKNNLPATKSLLKHFNANICDTQNLTGDNLIHLAIRYGDLAMIKYLIEDGQLIQQGNQSNLKMTPFELAKSLKCNDIIEYLKKKYSLDVFDDDDDDDDSDDD